MALLLVDQSNDYEYFCHKYKTSNNTKNRLKNISNNFDNLKSKKFYSEENIKKLIYLLGKDYVKDLLLFSFGLNNKFKNLNIEKLVSYVDICEIPKFPISGDYLKKYGYVAGEALGKKLKSLEENWINNNFVMDKKVVKQLLGKNREN